MPLRMVCMLDGKGGNRMIIVAQEPFIHVTSYSNSRLGLSSPACVSCTHNSGLTDVRELGAWPSTLESSRVFNRRMILVVRSIASMELFRLFR